MCTICITLHIAIRYVLLIDSNVLFNSNRQ